MHGDDWFVVAGAALDGSFGAGAALVSVRETEFQQALEGHEGDRGGEDQHRKKTCSAEKPGPSAESTPRSPAVNSPLLKKRSRTNITVTLDMLPHSRSTSLGSTSPAGSRPSTSSRASSTLGPPGWMRKCFMSSGEMLAEWQASSRFSDILRRPRVGMLLEILTLKPVSTRSQPMMSSVSGHVVLWLPISSGPSAPDPRTAAAAPSAKRLVETRLALERSPLWKVSPQSSTP